MTDVPEYRNLVSEWVCLDNGDFLALTVTSDGSWRPWVMRDLPEDPDPCDNGCWDRCCAPHDQLGKLPAEFRERLVPLCGRPTKKGRPCRIPVSRPGATCELHEGQPR
jgi:hypothetical protein